MGQEQKMGMPTPEKDITRDSKRKARLDTWDETFSHSPKFKSAWDTLSDDEKDILLYINYSFPGGDQYKWPKHDELEKSAKEKLSQAGIDVENLDEYLEARK